MRRARDRVWELLAFREVVAPVASVQPVQPVAPVAEVKAPETNLAPAPDSIKPTPLPGVAENG